MIVKFKTDDGFVIIECTEVITYNEFVDEHEFAKHNYGYRLFGKDGDKFKRVDVKLTTGEFQTELFSKVAYLMNNKGDTINTL